MRQTGKLHEIPSVDVITCNPEDAYMVWEKVKGRKCGEKRNREVHEDIEHFLLKLSSLFPRLRAGVPNLEATGSPWGPMEQN